MSDPVRISDRRARDHLLTAAAALASAAAIEILTAIGVAPATLGWLALVATAVAVYAGVAAVAALHPSRHAPVDDVDHGHGDDVTLAAALMQARTVEDVGQIAVEHVRRRFGASLVRLAVVDERDVFTYVADSLPANVNEEHRVVSLRGEDPAAIAMRRGAPAYWSRFSAFARRHPRAAAVLAHASPKSLALIPLIAERKPIGVYVIGFDDERAFDATERRRLQHIAVDTTIALDRALLFEFERSVATELQRSLLGPPVLLEGAGHTARYLPAMSAMTVGGDWYDTITLPSGVIGAAVGDAVGHGLEAATVMGQLRSALGASVLRASGPADAVDCLDEFASNVAGANSTTVAYAVLDIEHETVEYCSAGHPPPIVVSPDGVARLLDDAQTWPLGVGVDRPRRSALARMEAGSLLVLYSDGLVERRGESIDVGLNRLLERVRACVLCPIDQLADDLLESMLADSDGSDDVVLLILRSPVSRPDLFLRKMRAVPSHLHRVRAELRTWLESTDLDGDRVGDMLIAAGEACMNAVQHAYTDELHQVVRVEGSVIDDEVVVTITDTGTWKEHSAQSIGGRGMQLMRRLTPSMEVQRRTSGTSVTFRCALHRADERSFSLT
jgi:serine phosphatase RsbU (regulator of sigma subunit)/anti-sigma regulatory factor (Ser/Thr protein kinase)